MDGIIYKIEICNEIYIGSTIQRLSNRRTKHNSNLKDINKNCKLYETCRTNNINNITLIEIEKVKINNKKELNIIEQKYINELQPTLNTYRAYMTEEERIEQHKECDKNKYLKNKEKIKERVKEYRKNNKEKIKEKKKEKGICEFCGNEILKICLSRHKKQNCNKINN